MCDRDTPVILLEHSASLVSYYVYWSVQLRNKSLCREFNYATIHPVAGSSAKTSYPVESLATKKVTQ